MADIDLTFFDVEGWMDDKGIYYRTSGKNVTRGWLEVNCPFCLLEGDGDPSEHLGISEEKKISCWRCGAKGTIIKYIMAVEECDFSKAAAIVNVWRTLDPDDQRAVRKGRHQAFDFSLPKDSSKEFTSKAIHYLQSRRYDPNRLIEKYDLYCCNSPLGDFKFRIIIPVYEASKLVTYVGLDYTRKAKLRYKNAPNSEKIFLYNFDSIQDKVVIVEGITDVWRIGDGAVAVLGEAFTMDQALKISRSGAKKAYVMFDGGEENAAKKSSQLSAILSGLMDTETITLPAGVDPDSFGEEEVYMFREEIGL